MVAAVYMVPIGRHMAQAGQLGAEDGSLLYTVLYSLSEPGQLSQ